MGGHALKNTYTERKTTDDFLRIGKEIQNKVLNDTGIETAIVKCYRNKTDHGDLDLLVKMSFEPKFNLNEYIQNTFKPNEMFNNGNVCSFDYEKFQIDFIKISEESWNVAQTYFNYDCCGNIMGKTFHKFGLSYGWDGLYYKFRNFNGVNSHNILLTNNSEKIFGFGGYDYERYLKGFDNLVEIFDFCIGSKYFDSEMFKIENLNHIDKKRNRKRGSYNLFLNYLKDNDIYTKFIFEKNKDSYLETINICFPEAKLNERLQELKEEDRLNKVVTQKFNGDMVMMWLPDLQGQELGKAMGKFKQSLGDDYREFIINSSFDIIYEHFMKVYNG